MPQHSALLTHCRSQSDASVSSSTSSHPAAGVHAGRRIAVATAAPARELDQARRPPRCRDGGSDQPLKASKARSPPNSSRASRSHCSRSKRPHSAKQKHRGKAASPAQAAAAAVAAPLLRLVQTCDATAVIAAAIRAASRIS